MLDVDVFLEKYETCSLYVFSFAFSRLNINDVIIRQTSKFSTNIGLWFGCSIPAPHKNRDLGVGVIWDTK